MMLQKLDIYTDKKIKNTDKSALLWRNERIFTGYICIAKLITHSKRDAWPRQDPDIVEQLLEKQLT